MNILSGKFLSAIEVTDSIRNFWQNWYGTGLNDTKIQEFEEKFSWVRIIVETVQTVLIPILAIVAAAGVIWAIVLGVQMARADSTEKREEAKKRLIWLIVGIAVLVILIIFFITLFPLIMRQTLGINSDGTIGKTGTNSSSSSSSSSGEAFPAEI